MRIVGGALSGRRFEAPSGNDTRPTSDRVREAIASAIEAHDHFTDRKVLDLFCGSGAMGLEALSRGAAHATLVDVDRNAIRIAKSNCAALGVGDRTTVLAIDLERPSRLIAAISGEFDLLFFDPPYAQIALVTSLLEELWTAKRLAPASAIVIEHARRSAPELPIGFCEVRAYRYGDTAVVLARAPEERR